MGEFRGIQRGKGEPLIRDTVNFAFEGEVSTVYRNRIREGCWALGLCLGVLLWGCAVARGESVARPDSVVRMGTLNWPPYIGVSLENRGYVAEVVGEAFRRSGVAFNFSFMPWARVVHMSKSGQLHGYFPEYDSPEVAAHSALSDPFPGGPVGFFKRRDTPIAFETLEDLKGYTIGVVRGYVNTRAFDGAAFLRKEAVVDDYANVKKLLKRRVDLIVCDKYVGRYILERHFPEARGQVEFMDPPLELKALQVCFSKKVPGYRERVRRFNAGLRMMKADGSLDAIRRKHGFPVGP